MEGENKDFMNDYIVRATAANSQIRAFAAKQFTHGSVAFCEEVQILFGHEIIPPRYFSQIGLPATEIRRSLYYFII